MRSAAPETVDPRPAPLELSLLGGFELCAGDELLTVAPSGQRLLAMVALHGGRRPRGCLAGELWPDREPVRAVANLRGVVWRLPAPVRTRLIATDHNLRLDGTWTVDVDLVTRAAHDLRSNGEPDAVPIDLLRADLLPDWDEQWLPAERERHRQLRIHVLEELARRWLVLRRPDRAAEMALAAIAAEPLRESAQYLLVSALLEEGNRAAATAHYARFVARLATELAVAPSSALTDLVAGVASGGRIGRPQPA